MRVTTYKELKTKYGLPWTRQWIRKLVLAGEFPKPIKIGVRGKGFLDHEIEAYLKAREAARDAA